MNPRRLISRLALSIALGLLTTVGIAWTSATRGIPTFETAAIVDGEWHDRDTANLPTTKLVCATWRSWSGERVTGVVNFRQPARWDALKRATAARLELAEAPNRTAYLRPWVVPPRIELADFGTTISRDWMSDARGWPWLALRCQWTWRAGGGTQKSLDGLDLKPVSGKGWPPVCTLRALPYHPIPFGLTADTLLFAAAWSLLLLAPRTIRRHLRLRRGHCPKCSYDLAGLPPGSPCPECGHARIAR